MAVVHRLMIVATSALIFIILAIILATSLEIRAPPPKIIQVAIAQAAKIDQSNREIQAKGLINGTDFDRADILSGTSTISPGTPSTIYLSVTAQPSTTTDGEGMIGETPTPNPQLSATTSDDEGFIGAKPTSDTQVVAPTPTPDNGSKNSVLALSYSGSGGPKHCRGELIQKLTIPPPTRRWKNGTCIDLPSMARCGVFYASKEDGCEAQLFNMGGCQNTTQTYVNTVVFMPEERTVGAYWRSMWVRCGVEAPDASLLDPSLLTGLLKKPGGS